MVNLEELAELQHLSSNIRIIAATNRNLMEFSDQKIFRKDLTI